jgi:CheY-like chemotaxis protein
MDDYLSKPFKRDRFLAVVDQWVDRRSVILVADDAPENRLIVKRFLMLGGDYRLLFATNGREAVELFEHQNVSLVLLDMEMPIQNGFDTARAIRSLDGSDAVPIIAMTAHHDTRELQRCTEAGCTTVIQKPLERKTLNALVARHVKPRVDEELEAAAGPEPAEAPAGVVIVDPDIQDLVPRFLENQTHNAKLVVDLAAKRDFESVRRIGHNMKGTGKGYGFEIISAHGAALEQAASKSQPDDIHRIAKDLAQYLAQVKWQSR